MPFLQSSGAISLANIQTTMGGASPASINEYYRGGAYVPSSKTVTVREPTSGEYYNYPSVPYTWWENVYTPFTYVTVRWPGAEFYPGTDINITSATSGGYTYFRGSYRTTVSDPYGGGYNLYGVYRESSSTTSINTSVPSSGTISISQFYGAEKP
jgi:hypothetical protein